MQFKGSDRNEVRKALPLSVRRALSTMRAVPERAPDLAALAAMGSVSTRTLQRHFKVFLGKTPQAVLRDIRFERAHEDLLRASSTCTVTDIALRYAFAHLGRFSVEYRERFGEKPSETLLRRRKFLAQPRTNPILAPTFARELPTISVLPIAGQGGDEPLARSVADELATALMRAGVAVSNRPELARYALHLRWKLTETREHLTWLAKRLTATQTMLLRSPYLHGALDSAGHPSIASPTRRYRTVYAWLRRRELSHAVRSPCVAVPVN